MKNIYFFLKQKVDIPNNTINNNGGHAWVLMDAEGHTCGLGYGKEAKRAVDDCFQSCVHARTPTKDNKKNKIYRGGTREVSRTRVLTGDML